MKEFDWEFAGKTRNKNVTRWLQENHNQKVSEARFVTEIALIKRNDRKNGVYKHLNHIRWGKKVKPSELKREYAYLVKTFGFFI